MHLVLENRCFLYQLPHSSCFKSCNLSKDAIVDSDPSKRSEITTLLDWTTAKTMPWDIGKPTKKLLVLFDTVGAF